MEAHLAASSRMPPHAVEGKGKGQMRPRSWTPERMRGPALVPDDDGLENVLVHVVTITGEWLWSRVVPLHMRLDQLQQLFQSSDEAPFGANLGEYYKLNLGFARVGPYPPRSMRGSCALPNSQVFCLRMDLTHAAGATRSPDTAEMWITAAKVTVI